MARLQSVRNTNSDVKVEQPTIDASLRVLRQDLNRLRREARKLDQTAIEECLSLAIALTAQRRNAN